MDTIDELETQCRQMLQNILELKRELQTNSQTNKSTYHRKKDILQFIEDHKDVPLDINYDGGSKSGWRCECFVKNKNQTHVTVTISTNTRTFILKKIKDIRVSDSVIQQALKHYEEFHKLKSGESNIEDVKRSSAGISGWYTYKQPKTSNDISINQSDKLSTKDLTFDDFTMNFGKFHIGSHKRSKIE